jgi:futalosine hydrolase
MTILVVTAVDLERAAILAADPTAHVLVAGVGPAASAAATSAELTVGRFELVLNAGIGGGFAPMKLGGIAVASSSVFADLGVETDDGFVPVSSAGFGVERYDVPPRLAVELADATGGHMGTILTVATVTGSADTSAELQRRHPDAIAEGMEGAGVAAAAAVHGMAFAEIRSISNVVGPRRREEWDIPGALDSLGRAVAAVTAREWAS